MGKRDIEGEDHQLPVSRSAPSRRPLYVHAGKKISDLLGHTPPNGEAVFVLVSSPHYRAG